MFTTQMNATKFRIIDQTCLNAKWIIKESNIARVGSSRVNILKVGIGHYMRGKFTIWFKKQVYDLHSDHLS